MRERERESIKIKKWKRVLFMETTALSLSCLQTRRLRGTFEISPSCCVWFSSLILRYQPSFRCVLTQINANKNSGISLSRYIHTILWCNWRLWASLLDRCSLLCSPRQIIKNERSVYLSNWLTEIVNWISLIFWFLFTFHRPSLAIEVIM